MFLVLLKLYGLGYTGDVPQLSNFWLQRVFTKGSNTFLHHPKEDIIAPRTNHRMFPSNFGKLNHTWNQARDLLRICTLTPCQKWSQVKKRNFIFLSGKSSLNSNRDIRLVTTAVYKLRTIHWQFKNFQFKNFPNFRPGN